MPDSSFGVPGPSVPQVFPAALGGAAAAANAGAEQGIARDVYYGSLSAGSSRGVPGVGTVAEAHGNVEGEFAKGYYDRFAPGTSPYERLGNPAPSSSSGSDAASVANSRALAERQRQQEVSMQERELATRVAVAREQANAQVKVAEIGASAPGRQAALGEQRLPHELSRIQASTRLDDISSLFKDVGIDLTESQVRHSDQSISNLIKGERGQDLRNFLDRLEYQERVQSSPDRVRRDQLRDDELMVKIAKEVIPWMIPAAGGYIAGARVARAASKVASNPTIRARFIKLIRGFLDRSKSSPRSLTDSK